MNEIKSYFATPIYYKKIYSGKLGNNFNQDLSDECYLIRDYDNLGKKWSKKNYPGGYTSYSSISNLHQRSSTFIDLEKKIKSHVLKFASYLSYDLKDKKLVMTDFWINIMAKNVTHGLHLHPLSVISGTYYVKAPLGCSSIKFEDPRLGLFMAAPPKKNTGKDKDKLYVEYQAEAGNLVLFESWLRHEVASNPVVEDRISVSFNYGWV